MRVCVTLEHRFLQTPDGNVWTVTQFPYEFFKNYLEVFDEVRVIARVFSVPCVEPGFQAVTGPGVEFYAIPGYKGPFGFISRYWEVRDRARSAVDQGDAAILRVHSQVANSVEQWLTKRRIPFALEVVADPFDVLSPSANKHPVAFIARRYFTQRLKVQCLRALAVTYVTRTALQARYPPAAAQPVLAAGTGTRKVKKADQRRSPAKQFATSFSDVSLPESSFASAPRHGGRLGTTPHIVFVGTLGSLYKGPDVLIQALALCKQNGLTMDLTFIGSGEQQGPLEQLCQRLGIADQVFFKGSLPAGDAVRRELDKADMFVLPSRAEGVPRAMLEAMARGLPCIGTAVGGIPEILPSNNLVPPNDPGSLANKLMEVLRNEELVQDMSRASLETAKLYRAAELSKRRREFYSAVREMTEFHWMQAEQTA